MDGCSNNWATQTSLSSAKLVKLLHSLEYICVNLDVPKINPFGISHVIYFHFCVQGSHWVLYSLFFIQKCKSAYLYAHVLWQIYFLKPATIHK